MTYTDKLKNPKWQKKRLGIFNRDGWKCTSCSAEDSTLHAHHINYRGEPWECPDEYIVTLCDKCHDIEESLGGENPILKELSKKINKTCVSLADNLIILTFIQSKYPKYYKKIRKILEGKAKLVDFSIDWR